MPNYPDESLPIEGHRGRLSCQTGRMANWAVPLHSRTAVDRAGRAYVDPQSSARDRELALAVVNNWRSSHAFPLNTIQMCLRSRVQGVDADATVAQRIKRLPSITNKLAIYPDMKLSRMQDIGGCRAVLADAEMVRSVMRTYQRGYRKHTLDRLDDYMDTNPKTSGYRGVHLVYRYRSEQSRTYDGLRIEVQLRTRLQHAWATAVETVGFFTVQALKSSQGAKEWLRFFALMSSEIAFREGTPRVPNTPEDHGELIDEIRTLSQSLGVIDRLTAYGRTLQYAETDVVGGRSKHFLMELDTNNKTLKVYTFEKLAAATEYYGALERASAGDPGIDVVLVAVDSLAVLRRAYPNYFLDTEVFLEILHEALAQ